MRHSNLAMIIGVALVAAATPAAAGPCEWVPLSGGYHTYYHATDQQQFAERTGSSHQLKETPDGPAFFAPQDPALSFWVGLYKILQEKDLKAGDHTFWLHVYRLRGEREHIVIKCDTYQDLVRSYDLKVIPPGTADANYGYASEFCAKSTAEGFMVRDTVVSPSIKTTVMEVVFCDPATALERHPNGSVPITAKVELGDMIELPSSRGVVMQRSKMLGTVTWGFWSYVYDAVTENVARQYTKRPVLR